MMEKILYYSFHNIVTLKIIMHKKSLFDGYIDKKYKYFEVDEIKDPNLIVHIGKFKPSNENCYIIDNKYFIKRNYIYTKQQYKVGAWELEIIGIEDDKTEVHINSNLFGYMFFSGFVITPLIGLKMNRMGYPLIHASCVSDETKGYVFSAQSEGGKTMTAMRFVRKGFKMLGDDMVILGKGKVYSFITPLSIFTYNNEVIELKQKDRAILKLKDLLYRLTCGYIKIVTHVSPRPEIITNQTNLHFLSHLIKANEFKIEKNIDRTNLVRQLVLNNQFQSIYQQETLLVYSYIFPNSSITNEWEILYENIMNNLNGISCYEINIPANYTEQIFNRIVEEIN